MRHRVQFPASPLNMAKLDITAIVPCYNEEKTIGSVLKALKTSPELRKVIVVDDCSTDGSKEVIRKFDVQLISNIKNLGKGGSVKKALQLVKTKYVMMCDADLRWLHKDSITALLKPLADNTDVMAVGLRDHDWHRQKPLKWVNAPLLMIGGERALKTSYLKAACNDRRTAKHGLEPVLNFYCKRNKIKIVKVNLEKVDDVCKLDKPTYGWRPLVLEVFNVVGTYASLYFEDWMVSMKRVMSQNGKRT